MITIAFEHFNMISEIEASPSDELEQLPPSKSQRKRDSQALEQLGSELVALSAAQLQPLPLPHELREAVALAQRIHEHGGRRRQIKFIGKLLRRLDSEPIATAVARLQAGSAAETALQHRCEQWRSRLLAPESGQIALTELLDHFPHADRQRLRQLQQNARREQQLQRPPRSARELFRLLRDLLVVDHPS